MQNLWQYPRKNSRGWAFGALFIAMLSIQAGASHAKGLFPRAGVVGTVLMRTGFAALILLMVFRPWKTKVTPQWGMIVCYGMALGAMNYTFYRSIQLIPLGIAVACEFLGPLLVAISYSKKASDYLWVLLATLGLLGILPLFKEAEPLNLMGIAYALLAGFFWALYIVFGKKAVHSTDGGVVTALGMVVATLFILPFWFFSAPMGIVYEPRILWDGFIVALFSSAIPYSLEMIGLRNIPAQTFGVLMSLEPVLAGLSGMIFLHEILSELQWLGIVCVMCASFGSSLTIRAKRSKAPVAVPPVN